jgi:ribosomal protein L10
MVISRQKKIQKLDILTQNINSSSAVLCVTYTHFVNEQIEKFRDELFEKGNCKVVFAKNSLVSLACGEDSKSSMDDKLKTSNMLVFSDDIFSLISVVNNFVKSLKKGYPNTKLSISCGILDSRFIDGDVVKKLSNIPSLQSLHGSLISVLSSPLRNLVKICNNPFFDLVKILDYKSKNC